MNYPQMTEIPRQTQAVESWLGYRHTARIADGESYDEKNISADAFPLLAPRRARGTWARPLNCQGLIEKDNLCWVDGTKFVMNGYEIEMGLSEKEKDCPKRLVSMGAYVIILPDKMYINTQNTEDFGRIEARFETAGEVSFSLCLDDGSGYDAMESPIPPEEPKDGQYWIDTGSNPNAVKIWSEAEKMWVEVGTTYVKIEAENIGKAFQPGDGVYIECQDENESIQQLMGSHVLWDVSDNYIIVIGMLATKQTTIQPVTVSRTMPDMDYLIESGNRLWGCRYGLARNGAVVNEIYASKLGDFRNWDVFEGISTDSWVGQCGTDGMWTGAISYLGYPVFFKENHIHTVYGSLPSQFRIQNTAARGVQRGSDRSLAMLNEVLIYKSRMGVCVYDGSLPTDISDAFGGILYHDAVAGAHGDKYYISMLRDGTDEAVMMTYDIRKNLWHKEDSLRATAWCSAREHMYCIDEETGNILCVTGAGEPEEEPIQWEVVTGEIGLRGSNGYTVTVMPENKYISKLVLRMRLEYGSIVQVAVEYDGCGIWEHLASMQGRSLRSYTLPIRPRRCDWLRLKITGVGDARIYSLVRTIEGGSDENSNDGGVLDF